MKKELVIISIATSVSMILVILLVGYIRQTWKPVSTQEIVDTRNISENTLSAPLETAPAGIPNQFKKTSPVQWISDDFAKAVAICIDQAPTYSTWRDHPEECKVVRRDYEVNDRGSYALWLAQEGRERETKDKADAKELRRLLHIDK